jgi:hypothetical protein
MNELFSVVKTSLLQSTFSHSSILNGPISGSLETLSDWRFIELKLFTCYEFIEMSAEAFWRGGVLTRRRFDVGAKGAAYYTFIIYYVTENNGYIIRLHFTLMSTIFSIIYFERTHFRGIGNIVGLAFHLIHQEIIHLL